jgi:CubicO group peptidase (beta-lactamase class C family)
MGALSAYQARLDDLLRELVGEHGVPGAACGVLVGDEQIVAACGVSNVATGVPVTPDTLFQIGSITKVYTASLVLQAHAAGVVSLDEPVRAQLQEFMVADPGATIEITPRHLLTHTSGIEGDHLMDTGWNPDALQRYVGTLAGLGQIHATDEAYSFCNTGYAVAGRLLEVATGEDFDRVLRRRLTRPLGCRSTLTLPQHALLHRVAVGHVQVPGGQPARQARWSLTRSNGPMGGILAPASELLAFAHLHLNAGRAADGTDLLVPADVEGMQSPHIECPVPGEEQALGWTVRRWDDLVVLGQDADTFGQRAVLRVLPARKTAICVLANSPVGGGLAQAVLDRLAIDLLELGPETPIAPPGEVPDLTAHAGVYERLHQRITVNASGEATEMITEPSGVLQALGVRSATLPLTPVGDGGAVFTMADPVAGTRENVVFVARDGGPPAGLYLAGRLHRRVG